MSGADLASHTSCTLSRSTRRGSQLAQALAGCRLNLSSWIAFLEVRDVTIADSGLEKDGFPLSEMPPEIPATTLPFSDKLNAEGEVPFFGYVLIFA